jgi:hypothetical protein
MIFGVGLIALWATEALQAIAMLPELPTFDAALLAIHEYNLQQALAVSQPKSDLSL